MARPAPRKTGARIDRNTRGANPSPKLSLAERRQQRQARFAPYKRTGK
jgi:hypothetical protein